jgi:hypothetical protein
MQDEMWRQGKEITGECGLWNKRKNTQDIVLSPWRSVHRRQGKLPGLAGHRGMVRRQGRIAGGLNGREAKNEIAFFDKHLPCNCGMYTYVYCCIECRDD